MLWLSCTGSGRPDGSFIRHTAITKCHTLRKATFERVFCMKGERSLLIQTDWCGNIKVYKRRSCCRSRVCWAVFVKTVLEAKVSSLGSFLNPGLPSSGWDPTDLFGFCPYRLPPRRNETIWSLIFFNFYKKKLQIFLPRVVWVRLYHYIWSRIL